MSRAPLFAVALLCVSVVSAACGTERRRDPAAGGGAAEAGVQRDLRRVVSMLHYVGEEYPEAIEEAYESEIVEQQRMVSRLWDVASGLGAPAAAYLPALRSIRQRVLARDASIAVSKDCASLGARILAERGIPTAPAESPDLSRGRELFEGACASCHVRERFLASPDSRTMKPPPASFFDAELMNHLSPFKAFNFITFGVPGTAMSPFEQVFSERDRWALAFYVFTLRQPTCKGQRPDVPLAKVATASDQALAAAYREAGLACLRRDPAGSAPGSDASSPSSSPPWTTEATLRPSSGR